MPILKPFEQCLARPDEGTKKYLLVEHLLNVKKFAENNVFFSDDVLLKKLIGLTGFCHDMFKAQYDWQDYIKNVSSSNKKGTGPAHAPGGAVLFSFLAWHLLVKEDAWENCKVYWLWLGRDIMDHHGKLKNLSSDYVVSFGIWSKVDIEGLSSFVKQHYPELSEVKISVQSLKRWVNEIDELLEEAQEELDLMYRRPDYKKLMAKIQFWRLMTTILVAGDRLDIQETLPHRFAENEHWQNDKQLDEFCRQNSQHSLSEVRMNSVKIL